MIKYSDDNVVSFNADRHIYLKDGRSLESVTSFIKRHTNIFDAPVQAERYAAKNGLKTEDVLNQWEAKGKKSRNEGTAAHLVIETYFNTGKIEHTGAPKELTAEKFIKDFFLTGRLIPLASECIVYNDQIAGQVDMVAKKQDGKTMILDYKTNEEIKKKSSGKNMLPPFQNLPDANFYHYSLQLHIYKKLFKEPVDELAIVHLKESGYEFITPQYLNYGS